MKIKKFQTIFVSIFIFFTHEPPGISTWNLTKQENERRLGTCGDDGFPLPNYESDPPSWLWISTPPDNKTMLISAIQISYKHFLTSSANLLTGDRKWRHNGEKFDVDCTKEANLHVEVPSEIVKQINLRPLDCYRDTSCTKPILTPYKAYLPYYCEKNVAFGFYSWFSPMILEIEQDTDHTPVCFGTKASIVENGEEAKSILLYSDGMIRQNSVNITNVYNTVFGVEPFKNSEDFSGVILKSLGMRWTVVGYAAMNVILPSLSKEDQQIFNKLSYFQDGICSLTGICEPEPTKPTLPPTTTSTTKTTVPSTVTLTTTTTVPPTVISSTTTTTETPTVPTTLELTTSAPETSTELGTTLGAQMTSDPTTKALLASTKLGTTLGAQMTFKPMPTTLDLETRAPSTPNSIGIIEFTIGPSPRRSTDPDYVYEEYDEFRRENKKKIGMEGNEELIIAEAMEENGEKRMRGIELVLVLVMVFVMKI